MSHHGKRTLQGNLRQYPPLHMLHTILLLLSPSEYLMILIHPQSTSSKESVPETIVSPERKRPRSSGSDGNGNVLVKEELTSEPEPKHGEAFLICSDSVLKTRKKPRFVVHAAGDVGISGDGYRWRKYGQKMVKGNLNPRNYYRCTSAGCAVRKHIETAVDNINAAIITYKGVHDHDMPVPKK